MKLKVELITEKDCTEFSLSGVKTKCKVLEVVDGNTVKLGFIYNKRCYKKSCKMYGVGVPDINSFDQLEVRYATESKEFLHNLIIDQVVKVNFLKTNELDETLVNVHMKNDNIFFKKYDVYVNDMIISKRFGYEYLKQDDMKHYAEYTELSREQNKEGFDILEEEQ